MNSFCENLGGSLCQEFEIEVKVFVSKKKKLVHMSLVKPLIFYKFFNDIIKFIRKYLNMRKRFYPGFFFFCPKLNQSVKWRFHYITISNSKFRGKNMDELLDRFFERLQFSFKLSFRSQGTFLRPLKEAQRKDFER